MENFLCVLSISAAQLKEILTHAVSLQNRGRSALMLGVHADSRQPLLRDMIPCPVALSGNPRPERLRRNGVLQLWMPFQNCGTYFTGRRIRVAQGQESLAHRLREFAEFCHTPPSSAVPIKENAKEPQQRQNHLLVNEYPAVDGESFPSQTLAESYGMSKEFVTERATSRIAPRMVSFWRPD
jgi:hypothetical protein